MSNVARVARCGLFRRAAAALVAACVAGLGVTAPAALAEDRAPEASAMRAQAVIARNGMVVTQEANATAVGVDILRRGGNAVDAAVAVGFAMAASYPRAGNLGGGGFMVIHRSTGEDMAIDYRETAPAGIEAKSFLDASGNADPAKSRDSALGIGVPGTVAGLALAQKRYGSGKFTLAELIAPAIALARDGFTVSDDFADSLIAANDRLSRWPSARLFRRADGTPFGPGDKFTQPELAATLEHIAQDGPQAFYQGPIADHLAAAVVAAGGVMTPADLKAYRPVERKPVRGSYRGYDIVSMPPPSSGGVELIEMLNILEGFDLGHLDNVERTFLMTEAMKRAYADRALFLGDPDTVSVPVTRLTAKDYAAALRATIDPERATPASAIRAGNAPAEGRNTTHFSIVDRAGNAVANTYTLNFSYGVGLVAGDTGVLLNNELDDFSAKPEAPNAYGLIGYEANEPGPGKRPVSSMTPTIVLKDGKPVLVTGSPGGSRITTAVLQVVVNMLDAGMNVADAVAAPRVHNQWMPDQIYVEPAVAPDVIAGLQARGDKIVSQRPFTSANSIAVTADGFNGAADPRSKDARAAGF